MYDACCSCQLVVGAPLVTLHCTSGPYMRGNKGKQGCSISLLHLHQKALSSATLNPTKHPVSIPACCHNEYLAEKPPSLFSGGSDCRLSSSSERTFFSRSSIRARSPACWSSSSFCLLEISCWSIPSSWGNGMRLWPHGIQHFIWLLSSWGNRKPFQHSRQCVRGTMFK